MTRFLGARGLSAEKHQGPSIRQAAEDGDSPGSSLLNWRSGFEAQGHWQRGWCCSSLAFCVVSRHRVAGPVNRDTGRRQ